MANVVKAIKKPAKEYITNAKEFGNHLEYKRKALGFTIEVLSGLTMLNARTIRNIEKGVEKTALQNAFKLAFALGVQIKIEDR